MRFIWRHFILLCVIAMGLTLASPSLSTTEAKARVYTRPIEFDYITWDVNATLVKLSQTGLNPWQALSPGEQHDLVTHYIDLTSRLEQVQARIQQIYADPAVKDPEVVAKAELEEQQDLLDAVTSLTPLAESILQGQVTEILVEEGIARLGDAVPPLLFHTTPLPKALIVSPRGTIQQDVNLSLLADLTLAQVNQLEQNIEDITGGSALVVNVGGIGIYPTMVMRSSNLPWIIDTIAHEWTHNYLTIRPLGFNYDTTPELRTMNETTASIVGGEISLKVLQRYYPEYVSSAPESGKHTASLTAVTVPFDFRSEMHTTRVRVDELLAAGKIEEAEAYMEDRRAVFVSQGYDIRKLNQAYFAFYGAYADSPGGAAGEDPVGPAVRALREKSASLAEFLRTMGRMNSFEDLLKAIN